MPSILAYQSSEVDWCESNFQHSALVAEFYNTVSNVTFLIIGPLMGSLMHSYIQKRTRYIYCTLAFFVFTGLFSMYFHMTLSFLGQLLDEVSILWRVTRPPSVSVPGGCGAGSMGRSQFTCMILSGTVLVTFLSLVRPTVNAYALNSIAIHIVYIVRLEYKKTCNKQLRHMIEISVLLWASALISWISDLFFCSFWQRIRFFYLHSIWHVLISITFPYGMVTLALMDATYEMPGQTLKVRYWPRDSWPVGLPYIEIQADDKNC
ncbi:Alkaline ceramidase 1 [Heterocephalus glaber]|uniref:Alkaline ceramidase n=1 Tax=Heterocephalus glaber TaxID=10181 RepID=G5C0P1_HETGA|nr:Alkaline ceramidase 1 [Heterocephalus glaber]